MPDVKIIKPHDERGWVRAVIDGHQFLAKVYDTPSKFGINDGRVSKLSILKTAERDFDAPYLDQCLYNYSRGLDFDNAPDGLVEKIVAWCEQLPTAHD